MYTEQNPNGFSSRSLTIVKLSPDFSGFGGDERDRTDDPLLAKQVLSQLSYTPIFTFEYMAYLAVLAHILLRFLFTGPSKLNNDCKNETS